jgi:hypothetical protein
MTEEPKVGIFGWGVVRISAKIERKRAEHALKNTARTDSAGAVDSLRPWPLGLVAER